MRKLFAVLLVFVLTLSSVSCVFATDGSEYKPFYENSVKMMMLDQIKESITEINEMFPEAGIDVEENLDFAKQLLELPLAEQIEYFHTMTGGDPIEVYTHFKEDGSYASLKVYGLLVYESHGINMGTITVSGNLDIITGTKVWANNFCGYITAKASYYVNHTYSHQTSYGWINGNPYSVQCGGLLYQTGNWQIQTTGGDYSEVHYDIFQADGDYPVFIQTAFLNFNATTYNVNTGGVA